MKILIRLHSKSAHQSLEKQFKMKIFFLVPDSYSQMGNIRVGLDTGGHSLGCEGTKQKLGRVGCSLVIMGYGQN